MITLFLGKVMLLVDKIFRYLLGVKYDKRPMSQDTIRETTEYDSQ